MCVSVTVKQHVKKFNVMRKLGFLVGQHIELTQISLQFSSIKSGSDAVIILSVSGLKSIFICCIF